MLRTRSGRSVDDRGHGVTTQRGGKALRQGLLSDLSNPKIAVFFTSFLPQFVHGDGPACAALLMLGLVFALITLLWLVAYGMGGHEYGEVASALAREAIVREVRAGNTLAEAIRSGQARVRASLADRNVRVRGGARELVELPLRHPGAGDVRHVRLQVRNKRDDLRHQLPVDSLVARATAPADERGAAVEIGAHAGDAGRVPREAELARPRRPQPDHRGIGVPDRPDRAAVEQR
jgi:hypothetical protein